MDWLKLVQMLFKLKKLDKQKTQLEKLHDLAKKAEKVKSGKTKPTELKAFSDKTVSECNKGVAETKKLVEKLKKQQPDFPKSTSFKLYLKMRVAADKKGTQSPEFKKAEAAYKAELKAYGQKLSRLYKQLAGENAKFHDTAKKFDAMAGYCRKMSTIFQNLCKLPDFLSQRATFFSLSRAILALAVSLAHLADDYRALSKKHEAHLVAISNMQFRNFAWIKKDYKDAADVKKHEKLDKPK